MSKYIRAKDRIWLSERIGYDESGHAYSKITGFYQDFTKKDIIKQADTIEELIDCYAVILEHQDRPLIVFKNEIEHYKHCLVDKVKSNNRVLAIYGSIWAGADLLSKSKMNEEGELELL